MNTFAIGEVAIYVRPGSPYFGTDVTILSELRHSQGGGKDHVAGGITTPHFGYDIDILPEGCKTVVARPEHLKKKQHKRPMDEKVSWDECLWKPAGVNA